MKKADLVAEVSASTGMTKHEVSIIVEAVMETIKASLEKGEEVSLRGFGSFMVKHRAEKIGRNIATNTSITIPAHNIPYFKPSKEFQDRM